MLGRPKASVLAFIPWSAVTTMVAPIASSAAEVAVHHRVEVVGGGGPGRLLVLDVVGRRQVHHVGTLALHQLDAGGEHELGQPGAVDRRHVHADQRGHAVDAVGGARRLVGLFRREADAGHPVAEQGAQLVLGGDDGDLAPGVGQRGEDRRRAQVLRVVHHHFGAGVAVPEVVAADAVDRRRHAGDDRQVVGIGERRHDAVGGQAGAALAQRREERRAARGDGLVDVLGLAAVDADDDERRVGLAVAAAVDA